MSKVHPMTYEDWAFQGLDANGLVGLHISESGFKIVSTAVPRRTFKSFPMADIQTWSGTKKIFKFTFVEQTGAGSVGIGGGEKVQSCQLSTTWVGAIMTELEKVVNRSVKRKLSRRMADKEFAAFLQQLDSMPLADEKRAHLVMKLAKENYVTGAQGCEALRRIADDNVFDKMHAVAIMHRRMVNPDEFSLVIGELRADERENAWELIRTGKLQTPRSSSSSKVAPADV